MTFVPHHTPLLAPRFPKSAPSSSHDRRIVPTVVHSSSTCERARRQFCFELVVKTMTQWFTLLDGEACWGSAQLSDLPDELVHGYLVADTPSLCLSCSRIPLHAQCPRPRIFSSRPNLSFVRSCSCSSVFTLSLISPLLLPVWTSWPAPTSRQFFQTHFPGLLLPK